MAPGETSVQPRLITSSTSTYFIRDICIISNVPKAEAPATMAERRATTRMVVVLLFI
jgi:hypothetical protein